MPPRHLLGCAVLQLGVPGAESPGQAGVQARVWWELAKTLHSLAQATLPASTPWAPALQLKPPHLWLE